MKHYGFHITNVRASNFGCQSLDVRRGRKFRWPMAWLVLSAALLAGVIAALVLGNL